MQLVSVTMTAVAEAGRKRSRPGEGRIPPVAIAAGSTSPDRIHRVQTTTVATVIPFSGNIVGGVKLVLADSAAAGFVDPDFPAACCDFVGVQATVAIAI